LWVIESIFSSNGCSINGCHAGAIPAGGLNLDVNAERISAVYTNVTAKNEVNISSPAQSKLLRKSLGLDSHGGGPRMSKQDAEYLTMLCWIMAGAQNN